MRPITIPASASSNSGPSLSVRIFANSSALIFGRPRSSLCDFPRPRKCRTVRCARAQSHHSWSDGNLTSQRFSPPESIGTTSVFVPSKTGFVVSSIASSLLADVASGAQNHGTENAVRAVVHRLAGHRDRHDAVHIPDFHYLEGHLLPRPGEGVVGTVRQAHNGGTRGQREQRCEFGRAMLVARHVGERGHSVADLEAPLRRIPVLKR